MTKTYSTHLALRRPVADGVDPAVRRRLMRVQVRKLRWRLQASTRKRRLACASAAPASTAAALQASTLRAS